MPGVNTHDDLPRTLRANEIAELLRISRVAAYELLHSQGFPTVRIGRRLVAPRDKVLDWIEKEVRKND